MHALHQTILFSNQCMKEIDSIGSNDGLNIQLQQHITIIIETANMPLQILKGWMETENMERGRGQSLACIIAGDLNPPSLTALALSTLVGDGFRIILGVEGIACLD